VEETERAWDREALPEIETTCNARDGEQATRHSGQAKESTLDGNERPHGHGEGGGLPGTSQLVLKQIPHAEQSVAAVHTRASSVS
jgi:hypothetical protein